MAASEVAYAAADALADADHHALPETRPSQAIAVLYRVTRAEIEWNADVRAKRNVELKSLYGLGRGGGVSNRLPQRDASAREEA